MGVSRDVVFSTVAADGWSDPIDVSGKIVVYLYYYINGAATINVYSALQNTDGVTGVPADLVYNAGTHAGALAMTSFNTAGWNTEVLVLNHAMDYLVFELSGVAGSVSLYAVAS